MCDTMVALPNSTIDGSLMFAKNSDRYPNEAQYIEILPAMEHDSGRKVKCTYIEIPQVSHTHAVLLSKPYWIWGAEMGANEKGVVIGNEAVFSKEPYGKAPGLIGMDFLRLALERTDSTIMALHTIVELLERYGQSGVCNINDPKYYHNSFLIADRKEAWVLETSGKHWVAEKVKDIRSISNIYTIHESWDLASDDLVDFAFKKGWCKRQKNFDFGKSYSDLVFSTFSDGRSRQTLTTAWLNQHKTRLNIQNLMEILRSHGLFPDEKDIVKSFPDRAITGQDVCAHVGFGPIRVSQTTGSIVSKLSSEIDTHWVTGTSAPCTGIFKPVWIATIPRNPSVIPDRIYDDKSLWWQHYVLHREVLFNYGRRLMSYKAERDQLENKFIELVNRIVHTDNREDISKQCFKESGKATQGWLDQVRGEKEEKTRLYYRYTWEKINRDARIPLRH